MSLEIGQIIEGKYRIVRMIGEGGMGAVFEGENTRISRRVAIKVLHAATASNAEAVQRFEREAQAAGRIGSDHILEVLDLGSLPSGERFMVMEYLDGEPLSARIQRKGRLDPREAAPLLRQVLQGLTAAHGAGIIHRDLKPDNIFILKEKAGIADYVKIIDFGISKFQPLSGDGMNMTRTGTVMGTPYYMSPEQANGSREADARSDLYSIGVILYEAVTGRVPFDAKSFNELLFKIVLSKPPSPLEVAPDLDPAFVSIILKGMAREVDHRFQTAKEFAAALDRWMTTGLAVTVPPEDRPAFEQGLAARTNIGVGTPAGGQAPVAAAMTPNWGASGPPARAGSVPAFPMPGTPSPWATSQTSQQDEVVIPKKGVPKALVAGGAGAVVLLLVAAGALIAFSGKKGDDGTAAANGGHAEAPVAVGAAGPAANSASAGAATGQEPTAAPSAAALATAAASSEPVPARAAEEPMKPASVAIAAPSAKPPAHKGGAHPAGHPPAAGQGHSSHPAAGTPDFGY